MTCLLTRLTWLSALLILHPTAHEVACFGIGAFGEVSAGFSELASHGARVEATSYVAYFGDAQGGWRAECPMDLKWFEVATLGNEDERQSAPLTETLHCTSTRRASSRYAGETETRKPPKQRIREQFSCAEAVHVRTARAVYSPPPLVGGDWI